VVANSPGHRAFFARGRSLIRLTFDTEIHDVVSANGTVIDNNVPSPKGDGIPLLHLKLLPLGHLGLLGRGVAHLDVGHDCCGWVPGNVGCSGGDWNLRISVKYTPSENDE